ncbi:MAG: sulfite exporter TauE/SafE family protein [Flavobacteriales bacterium]|nr:sulfite exporter TauE/SafE family protein [Flavobacteriales bacterium]
MSVSTFIILIIIGLLAGILSGLVGVGGGILMIPLLIIFLGLSQHQAQGTALFAMLPPIGILAAINYYKEGFVKWEYAIVIAFTFVIGGYLGSKLSLSLPPQTVRRIFGVIMLLGAIKLISSK